MNKKIYFHDKYLHLFEAESQSAQDQSIKKSKPFVLTEEEFKKLAQMFVKPTENQVELTVSSFKDFLKGFRKQFYYIEAAGGFIEKDGRFLFIHRHGRWDLPKGKLEKKETTINAAVRECEEECGIKRLTVVKPLSSTYHIYPYKDGYALKQTYWYYMTTDFAESLTPQTEESIDRVEWFTSTEVRQFVLDDTYYTIRDVIEEAFR